MFYGVSEADKPRLLQALATLQDIFKQGNVWTNDMFIALHRNQTFAVHEEFMDAFNTFAQTEQEKSLLWRLHTLAWAAHHCLNIPGDFVECGVFRGFSSAVLCRYLNFASLPRTFYLYDTYNGLPEQTATPRERETWNPAYITQDPNATLHFVTNRFASYPNVKIVPGILPDTFAQHAPEKIAYLHIDLNNAGAEKLTLEHLFDRVSPGGIIVFDDFGWACNVNQTIAELQFMADRNYVILESPTGQGIVLKR